MFDWYDGFLALVLLLWWGATARDGRAIRIVALATIASALLTPLVTDRIAGAWKLAIPGAVETLTIIALIQWARTRSGLLQVGALLLAWLAHLLCLLDVLFGSNLVYDRYETVLLLVAALQIAACHDTLKHHGRRMLAACRSTPAAHRDGFYRPSPRSRFLPESRAAQIPAGPAPAQRP